MADKKAARKELEDLARDLDVLRGLLARIAGRVEKLLREAAGDGKRD